MAKNMWQFSGAGEVSIDGRFYREDAKNTPKQVRRRGR